MGLDHGLTRKHYVRNWDHYPAETHHKITVLKGGKSYPKTRLDESKISSFTEDLIDWRKANQIHNWFVENCNGGDDNMDSIYVSREQLAELLDTIDKVLASIKLKKGKIQNGSRSTPTGWEPIMEDGELIEDSTVAEQLLPTVSGFFFGSTEYDQWYYEELKRTKEVLEPIVSDPENEHDEFEYWTSW